ncbi:MAG: GxxExxY protein [Cyclobacteriaceae bacterium]|nr:GxxExxY protein [Cyclobacteriaceae bacterium]
MEVHRILGHGFLEVVYKDAIELEFTEQGIPFSREEDYEIEYKGSVLRHRYRSDFVVYDKIILEVKAQEGGLNSASQRQTINYLKVSGCKVGLVINFGRSSLEYKRLVL